MKFLNGTVLALATCLFFSSSAFAGFFSDTTQGDCFGKIEAAVSHLSKNSVDNLGYQRYPSATIMYTIGNADIKILADGSHSVKVTASHAKSTQLVEIFFKVSGYEEVGDSHGISAVNCTTVEFNGMQFAK